MNKNFKKKINNLKEKGIDLFYNEEGNSLAYKMFIRHISFSEKLGYSKKLSKEKIKIIKKIYLVNFTEEKIDIIENGIIKINNLKELE